MNSSIRKIAVCAGSGKPYCSTLFYVHLGSSVLSQVAPDVDLVVSGEMGHHDVLSAVAKGHSVLLFEHSHTERGYLSKVLLPRLKLNFSEESILKLHGEVGLLLSEEDCDPLKTMAVDE